MAILVLSRAEQLADVRPTTEFIKRDETMLKKQELQVKDTSGKKDRGDLDQHVLLHHQAALHYTLPPLPLHLLLIIIILLLLLLIFLLILLFKDVLKASRPSILSCRDL